MQWGVVVCACASKSKCKCFQFRTHRQGDVSLCASVSSYCRQRLRSLSCCVDLDIAVEGAGAGTPGALFNIAHNVRNPLPLPKCPCCARLGLPLCMHPLYGRPRVQKKTGALFNKHRCRHLANLNTPHTPTANGISAMYGEHIDLCVTGGIFRDENVCRLLSLSVKITDLTFAQLWQRCDADVHVFQACVAQIPAWDDCVFEEEADAVLQSWPDITQLVAHSFTTYTRSTQNPTTGNTLTIAHPTLCEFIRQFYTSLSQNSAFQRGKCMGESASTVDQFHIVADALRDCLHTLSTACGLVHEEETVPVVDDLIFPMDSVSNVGRMPHSEAVGRHERARDRSNTYPRQGITEEQVSELTLAGHSAYSRQTNRTRSEYSRSEPGRHRTKAAPENGREAMSTIESTSGCTSMPATGTHHRQQSNQSTVSRNSKTPSSNSRQGKHTHTSGCTILPCLQSPRSSATTEITSTEVTEVTKADSHMQALTECTEATNHMKALTEVSQSTSQAHTIQVQLLE